MPVPARFASFRPEFAKGRYDAADAFAFALASSAAYKGAGDVGDILASWEFPQHEFINVTKGSDIDTQCYIAAQRHRILIGFRGSEPKMEDWLANFKAVTDPGPFAGTRVHEGFQDALFPVIMQLTYLLKQYERARAQVWITGHSLGSALATLLSAMMLEHGLPLSGVYTYASPRVGSKKFEQQMNKATMNADVFHARVVNEHGVVPHIPPEPWFSHVGQRILLTEQGERSEHPETWRGFKHAIGDWFSGFRRRIRIGDNHRLNTKTGYLPKLERLART